MAVSKRFGFMSRDDEARLKGIKEAFDVYEQHLPDVLASELENVMNGSPQQILLSKGNVSRSVSIRGMYIGDVFHCAYSRAGRVYFSGLAAHDFHTFMLLCEELRRRGCW